MPTNNFIQFNSNKENMMNDESYTQQAPQGIVGGGTVANSTLHNKLFYQLSTFTKAFGDLMNKYNMDATDTEVTYLTQKLEDFLNAFLGYSFIPSSNGSQFSNSRFYIQGNIDNPGYIKFGRLYHDFIIQFGSASIRNDGTTGNPVTFPIAFPNRCIGIIAIDGGNACYSYGVQTANTNNVAAYLFAKEISTNVFVNANLFYIAIGK